MRVLSTIFILILINSCGSKDAALSEIAPTDSAELREDEQTALLPIEEACHLFSSEHNKYANDFSEAFIGLKEKCLSATPLNQKTESAVMESFAVASELFGGFDRDAHKTCVPQAKRIIKSVYQSHLRNLRPTSQKREIQKVLAKTNIDNHFRRLIRFNCLPNFDSFTYIYNEEEKVFNFNSNHLMNGSFEYFKIDKDFVELAREWTLVEKNKIPGWKVTAVNPVENKNCNLLEFQGEGVVTSVPDGNHLVELDSHCKNLQTNNVSGDSRVEILQQVPVKEAGSYRLTMKAQKRGGNHGELQVSVYQRGRDKQFETISLPNQSLWSDVCVDVEVVETDRNLKIAIRDGEEGGAQTYGLLLDDVSFERGSCP
jgi:hypothetical protein